MRLPKLYQWPNISWLLTGVPAGALFGWLDILAVEHGWWSDPNGWTGGVATLLGIAVGAGIWILLVVISGEQWCKHERGVR